MKNNNLKAWLYLLPAILFLGAFLVYPLIDVIVYSFKESYNFAGWRSSADGAPHLAGTTFKMQFGNSGSSTGATIEFKNPASHMVEEITVMGNCYDCALVLLEMGFEPLYRLGVEVVGRLVEQKHVRLLQQQTAKGDAAPLTSGKIGDNCVGRRALESIHGTLELGVYLPASTVVYLLHQFALTGEKRGHLIIRERLAQLLADGIELGKGVHHVLDALPDDFENGLGRVHLGFLLKVTDTVAGGPNDLALVGLLHTGDDFHQSRLSGAIEADDAYFRTIEKGKIDVFEDNFIVVRKRLPDTAHGENDFFVCHRCKDSHNLLSLQTHWGISSVGRA